MVLVGGARREPDRTGLGWNDHRAQAYVLPERLHPTTWTGDAAVRFVRDRASTKPFFLEVSFARPHSPYDPPERLLRRYADAALPPPHLGAWAARFAPRSGPAHDIWHGDLGARQARASRQGYDGAVTFVDEQLFDLERDPGEVRDLAADPAHAARLRAWRERLVEHLAERGDQFVKGGRLVPRPERCLYSPNFPKS